MAMNRPSGRGLDSLLTRKDFYFVVLLSLFSFFVTCFGFLKANTLYWDNPFFFTFFRDNLHSLNQFGEYAWWYPHRQYGWPAYYYSLLGQLSSTGPVQMVLGTICWLLGRFGVIIVKYQPIAVVYIGFIVPLLVNLGALLLSWQIFRQRYVSYFVVILTAFSPGVVFNLSDVGFLEPQAYSLFFGAAFLAFSRAPARRSFLRLMLSAFVLALNVNFPLMFWNVFAIPLFIFASVGATRMGRRQFKAAWSTVTRPDLAWLICGILVCAAPSFIVYTQTGELIRSRMGAKIYEFHDLIVGNPLEFISAGWPGFGFGSAGERLGLLAPGKENHVGLTYLGLLCWPLVLTGFISGPRLFRGANLLMIAGPSLVLCLSAFSPIFATLLVWPTPFRTNNHYGDALFRTGAYLPLVFAAACGLYAIIKNLPSARRNLLASLGICLVLTIVVMAARMGEEIWVDPFFGFFIVMGLGFTLIAYWLTTARSVAKANFYLKIMMVFALVDVATVVNLHVRNTIARPGNLKVDENKSADGIGLSLNRPAEYANHILMLRPYYLLLQAQVDPGKLPYLRIYDSVKSQTWATEDLKGMVAPEGVLALPPEAMESENTHLVHVNDSVLTNSSQAKVTEKTYNRLSIDVDSKVDGFLFIRDGYSRYWSAMANGLPTPIVRAYYNFKAIPIKAGKTVIELSFKPPLVFPAWLFAYIFLLGSLAYTLKFRNTEARK